MRPACLTEIKIGTEWVFDTWTHNYGELPDVEAARPVERRALNDRQRHPPGLQSGLTLAPPKRSFQRGMTSRL